MPISGRSTSHYRETAMVTDGVNPAVIYMRKANHRNDQGIAFR